jgi:hypothetical protein
MSNIFAQLQQEATRQSTQLKQPVPAETTAPDPLRHSDAVASGRDAAPSQSKSQKAVAFDKRLMRRVVTELVDATTLPNAISIRLSENEKAFIDDFILDTLRKVGLQGHQVSMAKLMRYSLAYLLLRHQDEFVDVLRKTFLRKGESNLFK